MTLKKQQCRTDVELPEIFVHETSVIDPLVKIGFGTKIWLFSHVLTGSSIGNHCILGQNVMVGPDVTIGNRCKIQNNVSVYEGVTLEDDVFCGPSCVFTNDFNPRADIDYKEGFRETYVEAGTSIGANVTIVCGVRLGHHCFIGAGSVVTCDVPPFAMMYGVPARQVGWVSHSGRKLDENLVCPHTGRKYKEISSGKLVEDNET
ncbi:MAG: N-acetyltransferase [Alphaproteobacteria bacterium]|nr:N-acetyltransferase [Alphaproteobacteria bacterium]